MRRPLSPHTALSIDNYRHRDCEWINNVNLNYCLLHVTITHVLNYDNNAMSRMHNQVDTNFYLSHFQGMVDKLIRWTSFKWANKFKNKVILTPEIVCAAGLKIKIAVLIDLLRTTAGREKYSLKKKNDFRHILSCGEFY